jgi:hypothetical protein
VVWGLKELRDGADGQAARLWNWLAADAGDPAGHSIDADQRGAMRIRFSFSVALRGLVFTELGFGLGYAAGFCIARHGVALLKGHLVVGIHFVVFGLFFGFANLFTHFGVCQTLDL